MKIIDCNGMSFHRWDCGPSTFLARPEHGARLMNWNLQMADGSVRDVIYWPENADFSHFAKVRGGNPILFPFTARTYHEGQIGQWRDRKNVVRPMPMHGFVRDSRFEIISTGETGFTAELIQNETTQVAYPFHYRFTVRYVFKEISLEVYLRLENLGDDPIVWSAGHHFYFALPWHQDLDRGDYRFEIPAGKCFTQSPDGALQSVKKGWKRNGSFGASENCDRIYTRLKGDTAVFGPNGGEEDIGIRIMNDTNTYSTWNAFVVWTETSNSPFYCVEPWMGPPNSPEHKKGLHTVESRKSSTFGVEVSLL